MKRERKSLIEVALGVIESESHRLREEIKKGKKLKWQDVKLILKGLGALAEYPQIQAEAEKKSVWYKVGLSTFAAFTRSL